MNAQTRNSLAKAIAIFSGMTLILIVLLAAADSIADGQAKLILVSLGSSIFGSGLTFFLLRAVQLDDIK
jgi:hypothetical protein